LLFLLPALSFAAFEPVDLGVPCNYTFQCKTGFCENSTKSCQLPQISEIQTLGVCNTSRDCIQGFCYAGSCVLPFKNTTEVSIIVGPKSGCAGLITFCPPGFENCYQVCDALWYLLVAASLVAAFAGTRTGNRLVPFALGVLPMAIGATTFVFLGILVAVLETLLVFYRTAGAPAAPEEIEFAEVGEGVPGELETLPAGKRKGKKKEEEEKKPAKKEKKEEEGKLEELPPF